MTRGIGQPNSQGVVSQSSTRSKPSWMPVVVRRGLDVSVSEVSEVGVLVRTGKCDE